MMNQEKEIVQVIADHLGLSPDDIEKEASLREDLSLGSLELNDLLNTIAKHFTISFDSEEISSLRTVEDLLSLVEDNLI